MNMVFVPLLLLLLLRPDVVIAVTSAKVVSFSKMEQDGSPMCATDVPDETIISSSLKDCSLTCAHPDICSGFNIKEYLTCDHVMLPVLASTSRIFSPVKCITMHPVTWHLSQAAPSTRLLYYYITIFKLPELQKTSRNPIQ